MSDAAAPRRFRIAFSFAGEKRDFVAKAARILADRFGEGGILYDKFHEPEFASSTSAFVSAEALRRTVRPHVPVICPNYDESDGLAGNGFTFMDC